MTIVNNLTSAWSSPIGPVAFATPIQCRKGHVFVSWAASAPSATRDGFMLGSGETIVVPAGATFRMSINTSLDHEVYYEPFTS